MTLRAYAATYLGRYGTAESVAYLIDALSDESIHVGANYKDAGMATTRHRANLALKELTGSDFGFQWNASLEDRKIAINKWKDWFNEWNIIIDEVMSYINENGMSKYKVYRAHLSSDEIKWYVSLTTTPPNIGAPALTIDSKTHEISLIRGR